MLFLLNKVGADAAQRNLGAVPGFSLRCIQATLYPITLFGHLSSRNRTSSFLSN
jgi:hypothetical protein